VHDHPEVVAGRRVDAVRRHGRSLAPAALMSITPGVCVATGQCVPRASARAVCDLRRT
jgi:hypothetical protein